MLRTPAAPLFLLFLTPLWLSACSGDGPEPKPEPTCYDVYADQEDLVAVAPAMTQLVSFWTLDCDAEDDSAQLNHGEIFGAEPVVDRFGRENRAMHFDGKGSYVAFNASAIDTATHFFTVSAWFRSTETKLKGTIFFEGTANGPGIMLRLQPDGAIWAHSNDAFTLKAKAAKYNDGAWHHVVLSGGENNVTLWLDSKLAVEGEWSEDFHLKATNKPSVLGRTGEPDGDIARDAFIGDLDDVAVFHRPLSSAEITSLFREGPNQQPSAVPGVKILGLELTASGSESLDRDGELVAYEWDFGDGSDTVQTVDATHTYAKPGNYKVTLTVTDNEDASTTATAIVEAFDPTDHTGDGPWPKEWAEWELDVLDLTNQARAKGADCGGDLFGPAGPLENDNFCRLSSRLHSEDMAERKFFEHTNLDGLTPFDRMAAAGYTGAYPWGENIAAGQTSPAAVVDAWMKSPGHCRNIMNPGYTVLGVGYFKGVGSPMTHYWTQNFGGGHNP